MNKQLSEGEPGHGREKIQKTKKIQVFRQWD
jgi:hypothetical protein